MSKLKPLHIMPATKLDFHFDAEERQLIMKSDQMSREEVMAALQRKRFNDLARKGV
jgi:hypothetical protein